MKKGHAKCWGSSFGVTGHFTREAGGSLVPRQMSWRRSPETEPKVGIQRYSNLLLVTDRWELRTGFMDRVAVLTEILSQNPTDAFARYGLAMEYSKTGEVERALEEFGKLLSAHPEYTAGYFMAAQTLASASRREEAKKMLADGIASAKRTGNAHAQSEMEAMLAELG